MLIENISIVKTPNQPKLTLPRFGFYVKMTVDRPPPTHPPQTPISQLLLAPFWLNFKGRFMGPSWTDSNGHGDICPGNICPGNICPYLEYLSCYWPDFDQTLEVGWQGQGKVKARTGQGQGKVKERSRKGQGEVKITSWQGKIKVKVRSKKGQGNIKRGSRQGQSKVKERSRQSQGKAKAMQAQPQPQLQFDGFWHNWN